MNAKIIKLIMWTSKEGRGTEKDPIRNVIKLGTLDGTLIVSYDPVKPISNNWINSDIERLGVD